MPAESPVPEPEPELSHGEPTAGTPVRSQPEARTPPSPASPQRRSPLAPLPICSQPQPSAEATVPSPTVSPIRFQPVPARTSTPLAPLPVKSQGVTKDTLGSPLPGDEALKRSDLVAEFWMKSAEIRRSLGLTPVRRGPGPEPGFQPAPLQAFPAEKLPQGEGPWLLKPTPVPGRLGPPAAGGAQPSLPTQGSPPGREPKGARAEQRDLSSSSGLGLQGSSSRTRTPGSQSFSTSDSTMLTPPSSPPPPPPDEEPATLHGKPALAGQPAASEPRAPATCARTPREPARPPPEEAPKPFVESVDEIPFADDVEDTYDDRTEDSSLQEPFFTPPSRWPCPEQPLAQESTRGPESGVPPQKRGLPLVSAEAKELAAERMRAREKSVRSPALRDAMARQLSRMKEMDTVATAPRAPRTPAPCRATAVPPKGPEEPTPMHKATSEEVPSPPSDSGGLDGSVTSSEGSSGKSKKRSSLFSPRRNKKEKKPKGEGRPPERPSPSALEEAAAKPRSLWKSVFSGYRKDKKKKGDGRSRPSTPSSGATVDAGKPGASPVTRAGTAARGPLPGRAHGAGFPAPAAPSKDPLPMLPPPLGLPREKETKPSRTF